MADVQLSTLGSVIKTAYEAESNTNGFTDTEKTKLTDLIPNAKVELTGNYLDLDATEWGTLESGDYYISQLGINLSNFPYTLDDAETYDCNIQLLNVGSLWAVSFTVASTATDETKNRIFYRSGRDFATAIIKGYTNVVTDTEFINYTNLTVKNLLEANDGTDDIFGLPVLVQPLAQEMPLNEAVSITPFSSGIRPFQVSIESGALPTGIVIDELTGVISGTASAGGSGTCTIRTRNIRSTPSSGYYDYILDWSVAEPQGQSEFLNTLNIYPSIRSSETDFSGINFAKASGLTGQINSSYVFDDSDSSQVYVHEYTSGSYDFSYLMQHATSSYWYMFKSNVAPSEIVNGLDLADSLSSSGYELNSSDAEQVIVDGIKYPVDDSLTWISTQNYLNFGTDSSLDSFLSSDNDWSYGFRVTERIPEDFLGRPMFCRENSNYFGWKFYNSTYGYFFYGKSESTRASSGDDSDVGEISAGDWISVTFTASESFGTLRFYVNGQLKETENFVNLRWDTETITNLRELYFGRSVLSNTDLGSDNPQQGHSFWQGLIEDLWISNGSVFTQIQILEISTNTDVTSSTNYASMTHAWRVNEAMGTVFGALKGGVTGTGENVS